jgi:Tol biopolymer transport system component
MKTRIAPIAAAVITLLAAAAPAQATYPGRNGRILFDRVAGKQLFTMRPDGSGVQKLTHEGGVNHQMASYSANGRRILYQQGRALAARIAVAHADGTHVDVLHENGRNPILSPGGGRIAFDNPVQILSMDSDGSALEPLTPLGGGSLDYAPTYGPDGSRIAFTCSGDAQHAGLCSMAPDGSDVQTLFTSDSDGVGNPDFAPNGRKVLVTVAGPGLRGIATVGVADSSLQVIRNFAPSGRVPRGRAAFSPNGERIALTLQSGAHGKRTDVYVMRADGTHLRRLTHADGPRESNLLDDWQPLPRR